jgi:DNA-binding transcriptional regulator YhcF (GntR family)
LNRDQFAVVLARLRERFRNGEWIEGEPLSVTKLAEDIGVSATPVREALARLAGEGLVEDWRGRGFYARRLDAIDLADLYQAQQALANAALALAADRPRLAPAWIPAPSDFLAAPVGTWEQVFETLMRLAGAGFLLTQQRRLADRLAPARRLEPAVLGETLGDFAPLTGALCDGDLPVVKAALESLHQRRRGHVDDLVQTMRLGADKYKTRI